MEPIYLASCQKDGGIYTCSLNSSGELCQQSFFPADSPMYLARDGENLWALLLAPDGKEGCSGLMRYHIRPDGSLCDPVDCGSTGGVEACHLLAEDGQIWCVNYDSGSVLRFPDKLVQHTGHSSHPRQQTAHPHFVGHLPGTDLLCVCDLGEDAVVVYDRQLNPVSRVQLPAESGPRHLAFSADGKTVYCLCELASRLVVLSHHGEGKLTIESAVSTLPQDFCGENIAAAVRLSKDEKFLYASNRGHDSIAAFRVDGTSLTRVGIVSCEGEVPRDFNLYGEFLLCANEASDSVTSFHIGSDGLPVFTGHRLPMACPRAVL